MSKLRRIYLVASIFAMSLLHRADSDSRRRVSALEYLTHLLSNESSEAPLLQAFAADSRDPELEAKVQKMENQLGLVLAELQAEFFATKVARALLLRASRYGLPSFDNLRFYDNYVISYDNRLKQPVWSMEYYWRRRMPSYAPVDRRYQFYFPDLGVSEYFRSTDEDYKSSEYYRGHFTSAFEVPSRPTLLYQSFVSSNAAPMVHNLHRLGCLWTRLEHYTTFLARRSKNMHVITGVLNLPADGTLIAQNYAKEKISYRIIGFNRVAVPSHFYKILLYETKAGSLCMEAFVVPNSAGVDKSTRLDRFRIDVIAELPKIENLTGLRFFELLNVTDLLCPYKFKYGFVDRVPRTLEQIFHSRSIH